MSEPLSPMNVHFYSNHNSRYNAENNITIIAKKKKIETVKEQKKLSLPQHRVLENSGNKLNAVIISIQCRLTDEKPTANCRIDDS